MMHCTMKIASFNGTFRGIRAQRLFFAVLCGNYTLFLVKIGVFLLYANFECVNPC